MIRSCAKFQNITGSGWASTGPNMLAPCILNGISNQELVLCSPNAPAGNLQKFPQVSLIVFLQCWENLGIAGMDVFSVWRKYTLLVWFFLQVAILIVTESFLAAVAFGFVDWGFANNPYQRVTWWFFHMVIFITCCRPQLWVSFYVKMTLIAVSVAEIFLF